MSDVNISAVIQVSTINEQGSSPEIAKIAVFKLLNGYIITTSSYTSLFGFSYLDYFHQALDWESVHFWLKYWFEENLDGYFKPTESYDIEHDRSSYPEIHYKQFLQSKSVKIDYLKDADPKLVEAVCHLVEEHLIIGSRAEEAKEEVVADVAV